MFKDGGDSMRKSEKWRAISLFFPWAQNHLISALIHSFVNEKKRNIAWAISIKIEDQGRKLLFCTSNFFLLYFFLLLSVLLTIELHLRPTVQCRAQLIMCEHLEFPSPCCEHSLPVWARLYSSIYAFVLERFPLYKFTTHKGFNLASMVSEMVCQTFINYSLRCIRIITLDPDIHDHGGSHRNFLKQIWTQ